MKKAQQYADELRDDPGLASDLVTLFERIQKDARHAALTEAMEIHMNFPPSEHYECQQALKQLRDNHQ